MKTLAVLVPATAALAALAVPAFASGPTVKVNDDTFRAKVVHIKKGQTVKWKWIGSDRHNVVFHGFKSATKVHGSYRHTFNKPGTYRYVCTFHDENGMKGTVVVSG